MDEYKTKLKQLKIQLENLSAKLDLEKKKQEIRKLEAQSTKADFWSDIQSAQKVMQQLSTHKEIVYNLSDLLARVQNGLEIAQLASDNPSTSEKLADVTDMRRELGEEITKIAQDLEKLELHLFLGGVYDTSAAIITIHAGQGGVEAMDWVAMLLRMYLRYAEGKKWKVDIMDQSPGEEAGFKAVTFQILGHQAYGYLKKEAGTHRLVRQSPFNADKLRQTSFALVEVLPLIEAVGEININPDEIEVDTFRSSGAGGQNVNKVNSAVRVRHLATGITVSLQTERSQLQNKENAIKILKGKLFTLQEQNRAGEIKDIKGDYKPASWGNQIRSYVLHPYKMVKDLRTGVETTQADEVLDGGLDSFIEAEIRQLN